MLFTASGSRAFALVRSRSKSAFRSGLTRAGGDELDPRANAGGGVSARANGGGGVDARTKGGGGVDARAGGGVGARGRGGGCIDGRRISRMAAALSMSAFDRTSSRVKRRASPPRPWWALPRKPTTRPSPRRTTWPVERDSSKRKTTPSGRGCTPTRVIPVRVRVSRSFSRYSSSLAYGRVMRMAEGGRASAVMGTGWGG
jgi:hypothetical protein